ncbi:MAG: hypothetical protein JO202_16130 [Ktedonobacteraceae bacterium]|nr:hypothetical protein [Ktedonobacteraceae bacterium]
MPILRQYPTFPVLGLRFIIYDNLIDPYISESPCNIQNATIQDFLQAVLQNGGGDFYLYLGVNAEPMGFGSFSLRMPPFNRPGYPYRTQSADLENFWSLLALAAQHLMRIPAASRDFRAAAHFYLEHTSPTEGER